MKDLYKTTKEFLVDLKSEHPKEIFLTGRSSTGKSTLAKEIEKLDYGIIELDNVVINSVQKKFLDEDTSSAFLTVYKNTAPPHHIDSFVSETKNEVIKKLSQNSGVLLDGAVANNELISQLFSNEEFLFVFLLPQNIQKYSERFQKRFEQGIKTESTGISRVFFERFITQDLINQYLQTSIVNEDMRNSFKIFAEYMIESSHERLDYFKQKFPELTVILV